MKTYHYNGIDYTTPPDPFLGRSPMHKRDGSYNDELFIELGGTITDDGEPTPEEKFRTNLNDYLTALEAQAREMGLNITVSDFYQAASTMFSTDLIQWAKDLNVPDEMISEVRNQILTYVADASRLGMTWDDIFAVPPNNNNNAE